MARPTLTADSFDEQGNIMDEHYSLDRAARWDEIAHKGVAPIGRLNIYDIPLEKIPPGFEYAWKRAMVYEEWDRTNWQNIQQYGWMPVELTRHPDLFVGFDNTIGPKNPEFAGFIFFGGCLLCERPAERSQRHRVQSNVREQSRLQSVFDFDSQLVQAGFGSYLNQRMPYNTHMTKPGRGHAY